MDNRVGFVPVCLVFSTLAHHLLGCVQEVVGPCYLAKLSYVPIESLVALVYSTLARARQLRSIHEHEINRTIDLWIRLFQHYCNIGSEKCQDSGA